LVWEKDAVLLDMQQHMDRLMLCMHCNEWPGMKDEKKYYNEEI
jgi:hypothetical protein